MNYHTIEEWDRYQKFLWETDPTELIKTGVERYQEEVLGVRNLVTCGDVVSIMQSMVMKEDLRLKNKGGYMQIIVDQLKIKDKVVLPCECDESMTEKLNRWQQMIIREDQRERGQFRAGSP